MRFIKLTEEEFEKYSEELGELIDPNTKTMSVTPDILKSTSYAIPCIAALDGDNAAKSQQLLQLMQIMQPYLQINPQTGLPIGWKDRNGNSVVPDVGMVIREYARLNKLNDLRNMLITIPAQVVQQQQAMIAQQQQAMAEAKGGGQPQQPQTMPQMNGPAEVGGQSMLTNQDESLNQQAAMEQQLMQS